MTRNVLTLIIIFGGGLLLAVINIILPKLLFLVGLLLGFTMVGHIYFAPGKINYRRDIIVFSTLVITGILGTMIMIYICASISNLRNCDTTDYRASFFGNLAFAALPVVIAWLRVRTTQLWYLMKNKQ